MRFATFIFFMACGMAGSTAAYAQQNIEGYYTGELRHISRGVTLGLQLDLKKNGEEYIGVLRSRYIEDGKLVGCDNFIAGKLDKNTFSFKELIPLRETNVPAGTCRFFSRGRFLFSDKGGTPIIKGSLVEEDDFTMGRVTLERQDTENSFAFGDELQEAARMVKEAEIIKSPSPTAMAEAIYTYRTKSIMDTVQATAGQTITIQISAPEADLFHKISIMVNGNIALLNRAPRQHPLQLTLPALPKGEVEVALLCHHAAIDINYMTELQITLPDGLQKKIPIPVSTFTNRMVLIQVE